MKNEKYNMISALIVAMTLLLIFMGVSLLGSHIPTSMKERSKEPIYFGATYMTMNNPYFEVINDEIRERVESNGDELITMDPALSAPKQRTQIRYLISQKVKVIFLNSVDNTELHDVLEECREAGVKVIAIDTGLKEGDYHSSTIVSDNYGAGVLAAQDMMARVDKASILVLAHSQVSSGQQRIQGFSDTIAPFPQYTIVSSEECEGQLEQAVPLVAQRRAQGVSFDVVMALNDPAALGALAAIHEAGAEGVLVYGVDGSPETKQLLLNGQMDGGSVAQYPLTLAHKAVSTAYKLYANKEVKQLQYAPVTLITPNNIDTFTIEGWQ